MAGTHYGIHNFATDVSVRGTFKTPNLFNDEELTKFYQPDEDGNMILAVPPQTEAGLVDITYEELVTATEDGLLIQGQWYRLTDFQTAHLIQELTPGGLVTTAEENIGPVEPLLLFAHRIDNYLRGAVYSTITGDRLVYNINSIEPCLPLASIFKGNITRRIVERFNISAPLDWQIVVWKMAGEYYQTFNYPYNDPSEPNLFDRRYGDGRDIYIGNSEYNAARPVIFLNESKVFDLHVGTADYLVIGNMYRSNIIRSSIVDVNFRGYELGGVSVTNVDSTFIITPIVAFTVNSITGNGGAFVAVEDVAGAELNSNSFAYRAAGGERRLIKIDTDTDTLQILTP